MPADAHHSMLLYDPNRLERIAGTVSKVFFGRPHSRFEVSVVTGGKETSWTMIAQDPEDARRFGYYEELASLREGAEVEIVGWPHRRNANELLGHQLRSEALGLLELIPRQGYARPRLYAAMDQAVVDKRVLDLVVPDIEGEPTADMLLRWIEKDHPIARAGAEVQRERARFVAYSGSGDPVYIGLPRHLLCQTELVGTHLLPERDRARTEGWVSTYNRVLAKNWELTFTSCGN